MLKDKTTTISCFVVDKKINIGEAKDTVLFQIGVKFRLAVINAIG